MKMDYDQTANAAYIRRFEGKVIDSEEVALGIVYDYDETDRIVGIEILGVKQRRAEQFKNIDFLLE
ncbi:MAG: DUF2283 domain-containing protein, partial [Microcystis sp.]